MADQQTTETDTLESPHRLEQQRRENRDAIAALGARPYGGRTTDLISLSEARGLYDQAADEANQASDAAARERVKAGEERGEVVDDRPRVRIAGRVMLKRAGGKLIWLQLRDHTTAAATDGEDAFPGAVPDMQVAVSARDVEAPGFDIAKELDLGDLVVAEGPVMKTKKGEITVWASALAMGAKSLAPPPEKWAGLTDLEQRYRRRYVDLYTNPDTMWTFRMRAEIVRTIREQLAQLGFLEVETPMLQTQAGGAAARPFITHMNALSIDLYMRIAPELYLKRLLVGGMPRVYEINRNFRNEGLDKQHNPEFTMLELYEAYGDVESVMGITEGLVRETAEHIARIIGISPSAMPFGDITVDYESAFDRVTYADLFERALGFSMQDIARVRTEAEQRGLTRKWAAHLEAEGRGASDIDPLLLVNELFEEVAEGSIDPGRPTWIMRYPAALSPLTRPNPDDPSVADRSDLFIGHMEVGPHYTELNDPDVQASRFRDQLAGLDDEESTFRNFDEDFVNALKVGMPPAGGLGLGIDRLVMLLLNRPTIRDVVLFPLMRPEQQSG
ncbi:MAG: lysine--tRNA ligase [Planctomycetota bacterium]